MTLNQASQSAIVNWQSFNVGSGESLRINQNSASAAMLARVVGNAPSSILGSIQANGRLYLVNPRGVIIGKDAVIDTASFVATTLNISDQEFLKGGALSFSGNSTASIENLGTVRANNGNVMLFAFTVKNSGTLQAPNGTVGLAAGNEVLLASPDAPDFLVRVAEPVDAKTGVENTGLIEGVQAQLQAAGGSLYELAINQAGTVRATGSQIQNGRVILTAGGGSVQVSGTVSAHNADGSGGEILVGGDSHGTNPGIADAANTTVAPGAVLDASSETPIGNGGKVVVWADGTTLYSGAIVANGGKLGGNGGNAEVSGKQSLLFTGTADLLAPYGKRGTLLLDPTDITIAPDDGINQVPSGITSLNGFSTWSSSANSGSQTITDTVVQNLLNNGSLSLQATNSITVAAPITSLTNGNFFLMGNQIAVNAGISLANGRLTFNIPAQTPVGSLTSAAGTTITAKTINVDPFNTIALSGSIVTPLLTLNVYQGSITSLNATNTANNITSLVFSGSYNLSGSLALYNSGAMSVGGTINSGGTTSLVSSGNLTLQSGSTLTSTGTTTLASTGGAFINDAGITLFSGSGRKLIYSSTDASGFTDGGLGYTQYNPVSYPNDPQGAGNDIYIQTASGLPLMTIAANNSSRYYGQSDPAFSATLSGGTTSDLTTPEQFMIQQVNDVNAGSYTIVPYGAISSTKRLNYADGVLTVNPAPLTVTANNAAKTYGSANPSLSVAYTGFVNGDSSSSLTSQATASTSATSSSNAGTYPISASGAVDSNYAFNYVNGTLTVNPAPLTVTANNAAKTYGSANPVLSVTYTGFVNGDTAASLTGLAIVAGATSASPVGNYPIIPGGLVSTNYVPTYVNGILAVHPAPLTITAPDLSRNYGDNYLTISASYSGFVNGDAAASVVWNLNLTTPATSASPVGNYPLTPSATLLTPNYTPIYVNGTLTVNKAPLYISINDATRAVSQPNPVFTATFSGLVNGDTSSVLSGLQLTSSAVSSSAAGTYPIVASSLGTAANYAPQVQRDGTLTVSAQDTTSIIYLNKINVPENSSVLDQITNYKQAPVSVVTTFLGSSNPLMIKMQGEIVDQFSSFLAGSGVKLSSNQINQALADPATRSYMMGTMLPFLYADFVNIINTDPSTWTPEQQAFVATMTNYIHDEKVAAANKAQSDYQAWQQQEDIKRQNALNLGGTAGIYMDMVNSSNPDMPPPDILQEAQNGVVLTNDQLRAFAGQNVALANIGNDLNAGTSSVQNAATNTAGYLPGAIADAGTALVRTFSGHAEGVFSAVDSSLKSKIFPYAEGTKAGYAKMEESLSRMKTLAKMSDTTKTVDEGTQAVEDISKITKVIEGAGEVLGPAGLVMEVVGNLVQIGVGVAEYAKIGDYKNALDKTIQNSNKQVTVSDLKNMVNDGSLFKYLGVMTASNGQVGNS